MPNIPRMPDVGTIVASRIALMTDDFKDVWLDTKSSTRHVGYLNLTFPAPVPPSTATSRVGRVVAAIILLPTGIRVYASIPDTKWTDSLIELFIPNPFPEFTPNIKLANSRLEDLSEDTTFCFRSHQMRFRHTHIDGCLPVTESPLGCILWGE